MTAWRMPLTIALLVAAVPAAHAQTHDLGEVVKTGDCFRYQIELKLAGEMRFIKENAKALPVKLSATASHAFPERVLDADKGKVQKVARVYESAKSKIERGADQSETTLRDSRKLFVSQRHKDVALTYSPAGALTRGELELIGDHFDTLALIGLLPEKPVKVGDTWAIPNDTARTLTGMADMTEHKLTGKLEKASGDEASFVVTGSASGVSQGAQLKTAVEARGTFDLKSKRITALKWEQKDDRDQGPINPASSITATITLTRKAIDRPKELEDVALVSVPAGFNPPGPMLNLEYRDPKGRYALVHQRDWFLTAVSPEHAVLRLMDKNEWVAQVTVTPWTKAKKGEHITAEQFKESMSTTSGWRPERELQSGEIPSEGGRWTYRLSQIGQLNGVGVLQNFYVVAAPSGDQVVLTFTLAPKKADKLGARDLTMAASVEIPAK